MNTDSSQKETKGTKAELKAQANRIYKLFLRRAGDEEENRWYRVRRRIVRKIEERLKEESDFGGAVAGAPSTGRYVTGGDGGCAAAAARSGESRVQSPRSKVG